MNAMEAASRANFVAYVAGLPVEFIASREGAASIKAEAVALESASPKTTKRFADPDAGIPGSFSVDVLEAMGADIGAEIAFHIETMYPDALSATPATFLTSVRNTARNRFMAMFAPGKTATPMEMISQRRSQRRKLRALMKSASSRADDRVD